jgi:hypothetical protein
MLEHYTSIDVNIHTQFHSASGLDFLMKIVLLLMCKQLRIEGQTTSRLSRAHEDPKGKFPASAQDTPTLYSM